MVSAVPSPSCVIPAAKAACASPALSPGRPMSRDTAIHPRPAGCVAREKPSGSSAHAGPGSPDNPSAAVSSAGSNKGTEAASCARNRA